MIASNVPGTSPKNFIMALGIAESSSALLSSYAENNEPFFLWSSFFDPHPDYLVPEPWDRMYDPDEVTVPEMIPGEHDKNPPHFQKTQEANPDFSAWDEPHGNLMHGLNSHVHDRDELAKDIAIYYGMISLMDKQIGRILDKLDELGLTESTLVIFASDHGHFYGHHGLIEKGAFHYEDMIKVPMLVRWPGQVPAGVESDSLQSLVDLAPSMLSAAKLPIPYEMTGVDETAVWFHNIPTIRDHIIVENRHQPTTLHLKTYVNERYKLTVYFGRAYGELFDLQKRPARN